MKEFVAKPLTPHPDSYVSVPSPRSSDTHLKAHHGSSECRPSPAYRTGDGEALESRAHSCIHGTHTRLERRRIHYLSAKNLKKAAIRFGRLISPKARVSNEPRYLLPIRVITR